MCVTENQRIHAVYDVREADSLIHRPTVQRAVSCPMCDRQDVGRTHIAVCVFSFLFAHLDFEKGDILTVQRFEVELASDVVYWAVVCLSDASALMIALQKTQNTISDRLKNISHLTLLLARRHGLAVDVRQTIFQSAVQKVTTENKIDIRCFFDFVDELNKLLFHTVLTSEMHVKDRDDYYIVTAIELVQNKLKVW